MMKFFLSLLAILSLNIVPISASAATRALVIASNYDLIETNPALYLANPLADAEIVAEAMENGSIDSLTVVREPVTKDWTEKFGQFVASLDTNDIAILYYAGHGFQIEGRNYFLASDGVSLIPLDPMIQKLTEVAKGAIIIVDACRNNPLADKVDQSKMEIRSITGGTRDVQSVNILDLKNAGSGLAQLGNLRGLSAVVLFSTEPGNVAEDGKEPGKGSPFAKAFAREVKKRQSLDAVMRKTAVRVNKRTEGRQSPWRQGDLPFDIFLAGMRALPIP